MKIETHEEALEEHKKVLFTWALEVQGLEKAQRIVGLHASRGVVEMLFIFLHKNKLIDKGFQLNHRWFKSEMVATRLPEFYNKNTIISKIVKLEILCETLAYGTQKPIVKTEEALKLFREIEKLLDKTHEKN